MKVPLAELLVLEADGGHTHLHTAARKFTLRQGLAEVLARLPSEHFTRIHRGYGVRVGAVAALDPHANTVQVGAHTLPLGRLYREELTARLRPLS